MKIHKIKEPIKIKICVCTYTRGTIFNLYYLVEKQIMDLVSIFYFKIIGHVLMGMADNKYLL